MIRKNLEALAEGVAIQVHAQREQVEDLRKLLEEAQSNIESIKESLLYVWTARIPSWGSNT